VGKANFNVLTDPASTPDPLGGILTVGYGWNGEGVVLDLLRVPADQEWRREPYPWPDGSSDPLALALA
jgi:hypothetical protein